MNGRGEDYLTYPTTVSGLAKVAIFTTNVEAENQTLINHKCICGALNRHFCQTRVTSCPSVCPKLCPPKFALSRCDGLHSLLLFWGWSVRLQKSKCECKCVGFWNAVHCVSTNVICFLFSVLEKYLPINQVQL